MSWVIKSLGKTLKQAEDSGSSDEMTTVLVYATNAYGKKIYIYIELPLSKLPSVVKRLETRKPFIPSDFGTVLAAGLGMPSDEVREEMGQTPHEIMFEDAALPANIPPPPKVW